MKLLSGIFASIYPAKIGILLMCRNGIDEIFEKGERNATRGKSTQPEGNANQFAFSRREREKLTTACRPSGTGYSDKRHFSLLFFPMHLLPNEDTSLTYHQHLLRIGVVLCFSPRHPQHNVNMFLLYLYFLSLCNMPLLFGIPQLFSGSIRPRDDIRRLSFGNTR